MSVIVRPKHSSDENLIYVFVKGAESSMFPICSSGPVEETKKVVDQLAKNGLRTLVYGFKIISREELNIFSENLRQPNNLLSTELNMSEEYTKIWRKI